MTPEALLKSKIRAWLREELGAYVFSPVQMGMGDSTLDILCCIKGKFVAIEVKTPGNKPTVRQKFTIDAINTAGGQAFWADSLEYTKEMLKAGGFILP